MFTYRFILLMKNGEKYANNHIKLMINIFKVRTILICT